VTWTPRQGIQVSPGSGGCLTQDAAPVPSGPWRRRGTEGRSGVPDLGQLPPVQTGAVQLRFGFRPADYLPMIKVWSLSAPTRSIIRSALTEVANVRQGNTGGHNGAAGSAVRARH
jgi:hypothetical protein